ncbi:MAG TPA: cbb3-type cytochrome oxidase assembly protein CcoS [Puia sp.]
MSAIILLLGASLSVAVLFLGAFVWSVKHHQFDDGFSPPHRILFDDRQKKSDPPNPGKTEFRTLNQN